MKKLFVLILLLLMLLANTLIQKEDFSLSKYFNGELSVYAQSIDGENQILPTISISNSNKNVKGESMYFEQLEVGNALKVLNAKVKFVENIDNLTILYCYTHLIDEKLKVKENDINLQICISDYYTVIGWPMILGSF